MDTKTRILVVDDEETLCEALRFNLESEGYEVDTACSAEEALAFDLTGYDLFLLDIMMGEISGIQLAGIIKSNPATASRPVIFCTAKDTEEDMVAGLDLGADDYIMKPYSLRNVLARVGAVLRRATIHAVPAVHERRRNILSRAEGYPVEKGVHGGWQGSEHATQGVRDTVETVVKQGQDIHPCRTLERYMD